MNSTIITSFLKDKACIDAFLFGSHISHPKASSDIDIVLFTESEVYCHKIFLFENKIFDVFEMSYEQAFEFLRLRHPLWLSAFSNGISLKNADITRLLLVTTQKILNSSKAVSPLELEKHAFYLESSFKKLVINQENLFNYSFCAGEFLRAVKNALFYLNIVPPCPYDEQITILTNNFGELSLLIKEFIKSSIVYEKHNYAEKIFVSTRLLLPEINYPIML